MREHALIEVQNRLLSLYREASSAGQTADTDSILSELRSIRNLVRARGSDRILDTYQRFVDLIGIRLPKVAQASELRLTNLEVQQVIGRAEGQTRDSVPQEKANTKPVRLGSISEKGNPGISLVTCCMNRNQNLLKALPSWLQHDEIDEIVIVDWSSSVPVIEEVKKAAIEDRRIRIVRVDGEPRWILSYAFNAGFRVARHGKILKVDADIILSKDFFVRNSLGDGEFIAGNWRNASKNQAYVNGFFFAPRVALHAVGGFNEYITTYGWDDDDIYHRMTAAGFARRDVAADCVHHLDHSDEARLGDTEHEVPGQSAMDTITADTLYKIRRNRYIANIMPRWESKSRPVDFDVGTSSPNYMELVRDEWVPSALPPHVDRQADYIALWEIASWRLGPRIRVLEEPALRALLAKPLESITKLDIELAATTPAEACSLSGPYCVLRIPDLVSALKKPHASSKLEPSLVAIVSRLQDQGFQAIIQAPTQSWFGSMPNTLKDLPLLPTWVNIGEPRKASIDQLQTGNLRKAQDVLVELNATDLTAKSVSCAPAIAVSRAKIYIDVQHGLGNRLRAIGSAAAIAEAAGRELVIVWQPDDHCDCRFSDLFDYDGAVIEESFLNDAGNADIYNYMAIEGGEKDAPIREDAARDIYARSAFVLNSSHSDWARENRFIRSLKPVEAVQALVNSVRHPNDVSVHVRMEGGRKDEHLPYESTANWTEEDHDLIDLWRSRSHFSHFMKRIDALIAEGAADCIFIAADKPATYEEFWRAYPGRFAWLERSLYDRSAEQLRYALADAILLSRAPLFLGSTWSSFSELAQRLSLGGMTVEMSGRDF